MISRQIAAEGVKPIVVVTDEPEKYPMGTNWAPGVTVRHRDELDAVQRELAAATAAPSPTASRSSPSRPSTAASA
jgi:hypothetical protein